ncbi:ParB/RepB/Spo0J family partition protein [Melaminivora sp.]|uniref:ParB/RepB/Spo0J family partition protein n=1 Tax=Melaminivora sp. TaxID=1933032 RepID=UPI0028AA1123|nr:ParB/RepB/Spo0J family partition protein [Melaminivora sp.]
MTTDMHDTVTAPLPTPSAGPQMRMVEVALIEESTTNPRKHFDQPKLQELADSIAATGVHQPILLRPLPGHRVPDTWGFRRKGAPLPEYELVAGARRLRACRLARVAEVPAMIRELTDEQALEIQVIENLQREDVTELEEAEGYEVLMRTSAITADQVGAKIGKSRSYVYARLKILELCYEAREALREGTIDFSKALLIARIANEGLQRKALAYCTRPRWDGGRPSYRECARHVQEEYMLKLDAARFRITDASLMPAAGSCRECVKRTGANPDLFADVGSADVCTDPACYRAKEEAHAAAIKREALARGQHIIEGREAKALMPNSWSNEVKGYLRLDDKRDSPTDKPLRKLIGKAMEQQGIQPTLVANPHQDGQLVAVLTHDQVEGLLKHAGAAEAAAKIDEQARQEAQHAKSRANADAKQAYETQWRWDLLASTWQQIKDGTHEAPSDAVMRLIATNMARAYNQDRAKRLCKLLDLGKVAPQAGLLQYIADTDAPGDVLQLLVMFGDVEYRHWLGRDDNEGLMLVAGDYGVDPAAVKAKTKANQRAAAKAQAEREAAKAAAPKPALPRGPAAPAPAVRGVGKAKKAPAARAGAESPKTSAAHASAQIADALAALEEGQDVAPAAQSDEAPPVPSGQAAGVAPGASPSAFAPAAKPAGAPQASAAPTAASRAAPDGRGSADVSDGAAAKPAVIAVGLRVRINGTATGKQQKPWIDHEGLVVAQLGDRAWSIDIERSKRCGPKRVVFDQSELEVLQ